MYPNKIEINYNLGFADSGPGHLVQVSVRQKDYPKRMKLLIDKDTNDKNTEYLSLMIFCEDFILGASKTTGYSLRLENVHLWQSYSDYFPNG